MPSPHAEYRVIINMGGQITPMGEAKISAMDHGLLYGDSIYETMCAYEGTPFLLERHLDRLQRSLKRVFLPLPVSRQDLREEIRKTIEVHQRVYPTRGNLAVRLVITRGVGPIGLDISRCHESNFLVYAFELQPLSSKDLEDGIPVVISKTRRNHPRALDPAIKSGNFLNNIMAFKDARDAGAHEAIIPTAEGYLGEGTTSNLFVVKDDMVWTPLPYGILDGITRAVVIEEARAAGIHVGETNIPPEALFSADEAFITSSIKAVLGISSVNGLTVGRGVTGPITRTLLGLYRGRVERDCLLSSPAL